jgi:hypothetical protein
MKFLIIGCYSYSDGYKAMNNGFTYLGHDIAFFPLYAAQNNIETEILNAVNGQKLSIELDGYINNNNNKCNYIIMWHGCDICDLYHKILLNIKNKSGVKLIQINWNPDPIFKNDLDNYYKDFDYIFSVSPKICKYLNIEKKYKSAYHFYQAFDEKYSFYKKDDNYKCDVSIMCTNLYTDDIWKDKKLNRKKILDILYSDTSITLKIYGPTFLNNLYPNSYKGYINYNNAYSVFSNSLINLNICSVGDVITDKISNKDCYYFSERLPQIMACNGLMVCDQTFGNLFKNDKEYVLLKSEEDIIQLVKDVKKNTKKYDRIRKNGYNKIKNNFNCNSFAKQILNKLK